MICIVLYLNVFVAGSIKVTGLMLTFDILSSYFWETLSRDSAMQLTYLNSGPIKDLETSLKIIFFLNVVEICSNWNTRLFKL